MLYTLSNVPAPFDSNVRATVRQFRVSHQTHQTVGAWANTPMAVDVDYQQAIAALRELIAGAHRLAPLLDSDETIAAVAALHKQLSKLDVTRVNKTTNPKALRELQKQTRKGRDVDIRGRTLRIMASKREHDSHFSATGDSDDKVPAKMLGAIRAVTTTDRVLAFVTASGVDSMAGLQGQSLRVGKTDFVIDEGGLGTTSLYGREIEVDRNLGGDPIAMKPCAAKKLMTLVSAALDRKKREQVASLSLTETDWTSGKQLLVGGKSATQTYIIGELPHGVTRVRSCENCVRYLSRYICDQDLS